MKCQSFVVVDFVVEEVKRKWGNVRSQYGDELRKMRQFKSGMGTDEIYSSK